MKKVKLVDVAVSLTRDEVIDRVVERIMADLENGAGIAVPLDRAITAQVDAAVKRVAEEKILPLVKNGIDTLILQHTNAWGEKVGAPVTFIEYIIQRAEAYLTELVNYEGKSKSENPFSYWQGTQTRITQMVHQHLHYSIQTAMEKALKDANSAIIGGIEATVKIKLQEVADKLKVTATAK